MLTAGAVSYGYDANGNQTSRGSDTFTYDHENRLLESIIGAVTSTSGYDGDGLRMSLDVDDGVNPPVTTDYVWDVNRSLPVILDDGSNRYVYGLDLIASIDSSDDETYYTYDGLGSTADLTDDTATVTDTYSYDVFGAVRTSTGSSDNDWLFTGEQHDEDSDLYYLRARYYDSTTGRFLSQDPWTGFAGAPQTQHPYAYVVNSPANLVDPSGLCPGSCEGGFSQLCYSPNCAPGAPPGMWWNCRPMPPGYPTSCILQDDFIGGLWFGYIGAAWQQAGSRIDALGDVNWNNVIGCVSAVDLMVTGSAMVGVGIGSGQVELVPFGAAFIHVGLEQYREYCL